jgi:hypothetical protein
MKAPVPPTPDQSFVRLKCPASVRALIARVSAWRAEAPPVRRRRVQSVALWRAALLAAALSSNGCLVLALQPAYDDRSVVFDESLLGRWENKDDQTQLTIERGEWRS